jgi:O-acetyl-ADP-ribose deacetylase (regulator of RNase III)
VERFAAGRAAVEVVEGDITREDVDAIVNAANSRLAGGGGVDGAIHRAGGPEILAECREIVRRSGRLEPGRAVATTAGRMPARRVIHTVGPVYSGSPEDPATLASCYTESLRVAEGEGLASVAFPAVSAGVYGYPMDEACRVAARAVKARLEAGSSVALVRFVMFGRKACDAMAAAAREVFGRPGRP